MPRKAADHKSYLVGSERTAMCSKNKAERASVKRNKVIAILVAVLLRRPRGTRRLQCTIRGGRARGAFGRVTSRSSIGMSQNSIATSEEKKKPENSDEQHSDHDNVPESEDSSSSDEEEEVEEVAKDIVQIPLVNSLIYRLLSAKVPDVPDALKKDPLSRPTAPLIDVELKPEDIFKLCEHAIESLKKQKSLLRIDNATLPLVVCGDIHGQFRDLRGVFSKMGLPYTQSYLFMGDYVDRGAQGIEVAVFLLALKIKFPTKVFMLRGNHEDRHTTMSYGFYDECMKRYADDGEAIGEKVFSAFMTVFNYLPLAAHIDGVILCMHGGLSPHMTTIDDIDKIQRPCIIPAYGLACDLVWSDPSADETRDGWSMSPRGISFNFGPSIVEEFCKRNKLDLIVRAHQCTNNDGYKFACKGRVLTVFTAPNYQNQKNDGAMLRISKNHKCRLVILRTTKKKKRQEIEDDCTE
ncbi:hypothetical protein QR680_010105 [Steinernema hermaphroditum]|uniref:Serine/threonine-protein phosphatase n=1 Tax=Steinernema hermaphroditum TaxID=289476 RepID=A0AA39IMR8_9BILA|nr:hypothetical protein QR680_010105 [Steinernema hermaphroditum]